MRRLSRGSAIVEFALVLPILIALVLPTIQLLRAALLEMRLEVLAFRVARRLSESAVLAADLPSAASDLAIGVWPGVSCAAGVRPLVSVPSPFPRRRRAVEIIEVDLSAEGPHLLAGLAVPLRAHAREFHWEAS
jgi:hypothetical protein